jgi:ATP-dependent protease HslVU (ClpYQ) ATPase subunit
VIERIMEDISFTAPEVGRDAPPAPVATAAAGSGSDAPAAAAAPAPRKVVVDRELVRRKLLPMLERTDLSRFIL